MPSLDLDPSDYSTAGREAIAREASLKRVVGDASSELSRGYNMAGSDDGGEQYSSSYDPAVAEVFSALEDSVAGLRWLARALIAAGAIHSTAERGARGLSGAGPGLVDPGPGTALAASLPPTSSGGNASPIPGWELIVDFVGGMFWPDADVDRLREAGRAWAQLARDLRSEARELRGLTAELSGITTDEVSLFETNIEELASQLDQIADAVDAGAEGLGGLCDSYATQVEDTRNETTDMLKDLAIELAATVGVGVVLSFVTFGGAGAAAAAVAVARTAAVGARVVSVLNRLRMAASAAANQFRAVQAALRALQRWRAWQVAGSNGAKFTRAAVTDGTGSFVAAFWTKDDTSPFLAAASSAGGGFLGNVASSAKYLDNVAGRMFGGVVDGVSSYGIETVGKQEEFQLSDAVLSAVLGGATGALPGGSTRARRDVISGRNQADLGGTDFNVRQAADTAPTSGRPTAEAATATSGSATRTDVDAPVRGGGDVAAAQGAGTASKVPEGEAPVSGGGEVAGASAEGGGVKVPDGEAPVAADVDVPSGSAVADAPSVDAGAAPDASVSAADAPSAGAANSAVEASPSHFDRGVEVDARADAPVRSVADAADGDGPVRRLPGGRGRDDVDSADAGTDVHSSAVETAGSNVEAPTSPDVETSSSRADGEGDAEGSADAQARSATDGTDADGSQSKADGDSGTVADSDVSPQSSDVDGVTGDADAAGADGAGTSQDASVQAGAAPGRESWEGIDRFPDNYSTEMRVLDPSDPNSRQVVTLRDENGTVVRQREIPATPAISPELRANGLTDEVWARTYMESTHNMDTAGRATLGSYVGDPEMRHSSYEQRAMADGDAYFNYGEWVQFQNRYGSDSSPVPDRDMFEFFNKPFLEDAQARGMDVRFTHDPTEAAPKPPAPGTPPEEPRALWKEYLWAQESPHYPDEVPKKPSPEGWEMPYRERTE
ncbi:hypothetical protein ON058_02880 [Demequina sp. B12]|uniref:WXG100-like domain-containing protein n=1 Tax=Demequina sp. B12 TaxID=2992757 RepID=UPI00237B44FF|nr:hypothetical protein [Demequina sp. B12]MDE0572355.1 hypothetical protein [Demequina sp. B12]